MSARLRHRLIAVILCISLLSACVTYSAAVDSAQTQTGVVASSVTSYLNVRVGAGTDKDGLTDKNGERVRLNAGHEVEVVGTYKASDDSQWYKVTFDYGGETLTGYVSAEYITVTLNPVPGELSATFEESIEAFPESYKPSLRALHLIHPEWSFKALKTGLKWSDAIKNETVLGRSLTSSSILSYRSTVKGAYDWSTDRYIALDGSSWYQAADSVVAYYMDPRNFLNESDIFQFEALYYDSATQTLSGVESMLSGTFMDGVYITNGTKNVSYAQAFIDAASASGVSPYHLVARVIQEVGRNGSSSVSGLVSGYEGIYNYYNIGASSGSDPVRNGLKFASTGGSLSSASKTKYLIPWNTRYKSVVGGAKYISSNYISIGQNTLYLQKFDVDSSDGSLYWHQYMTNISASASEAKRMYSNYKDLGLLGESVSFSIPVYDGMPAKACSLPEAKGCPNNLLKSLSVSGYELTPDFKIESDTSKYYLIISKSVSSVTVNASAVCSSASVSGTGTKSVKNGINTLEVAVKAQSGDVKKYTLIVVVNDDGFEPGDEGELTTEPTSKPTTEPTTEPASEPTSKPTQPSTTGTTAQGGGTTETKPSGGMSTSLKFSSSAGGTVYNILPSTKATSLVKALGLYGNASAYVTDAKGQRLADAYAGTGSILVLTVDGKTQKHSIIIRGDVNGDGKIDAIDLLIVRKNILGTYSLSGVLLKAADCDGDGKVTAVDLLMVRKNILGTYTVSQSVAP